MEVSPFAKFKDQRVYLDTNGFVYFLEKHPEFYLRVLPLFDAAMQGELQLVTSELTVAELLVQPYKMGRADIATTYRRFLKDEGLIDLVPVSLGILEAAAACRATLGGSLADTIHVATANLYGCSAFVTNDQRIRSAPPLKILQLAGA